MEPRRDEPKMSPEPRREEPKPRRFRIVKLEERIAPFSGGGGGGYTNENCSAPSGRPGCR
jgi:hypothetical protein